MAVHVRSCILGMTMSMQVRDHENDPRAFRSLAGVRVLIVEDHKLFADALRWVLERRGMEVVGLTASGDEALAIAQHEQPDLVLLNLGLPDMSGLAVGKRLLDELPETKLVAVTAVAHPQTIKRAIRLGFHGCLTFDYPVKQFISSLLAILAGQVVIPQQFGQGTSGLLRAEERAARAMAEELSPREREILALLVDGLNNRQIAERLEIAPNTVRAHAQRILTKLEVHSRLEAAAFAVRHGLVELAEREGSW